jgi:hypothetical protein
VSWSSRRTPVWLLIVKLINVNDLVMSSTLWYSWNRGSSNCCGHLAIQNSCGIGRRRHPRCRCQCPSLYCRACRTTSQVSLTRDPFIMLYAHGPHDCLKEIFMLWAFLVLCHFIVSDLISSFFLFQDDLSSLPRPTRPCRGIELSVRNRQASLTRSVLASTILSDRSIVSIVCVLRRDSCSSLSFRLRLNIEM